MGKRLKYLVFIEDSGRMKTGWIKDNSTWYFLDRNTGGMRVGIIEDKGSIYYLKGNGSYVGQFIRSEYPLFISNEILPHLIDTRYVALGDYHISESIGSPNERKVLNEALDLHRAMYNQWQNTLQYSDDMANQNSLYYKTIKSYEDALNILKIIEA